MPRVQYHGGGKVTCFGQVGQVEQGLLYSFTFRSDPVNISIPVNIGAVALVEDSSVPKKPNPSLLKPS